LSENNISLFQGFLLPLSKLAEFSSLSLLVALHCILVELGDLSEVAAVKTPVFCDRKSVLGDLVVLMGRTLFTDELDTPLDYAAQNLLVNHLPLEFVY
jgi:hypothetical protein